MWWGWAKLQTQTLEEEKIWGFYRAVWSISTNIRKIENNNQKSKKANVNVIPRRKQIFATKPTTWQGICLLYSSWFLIVSSVHWVQNCLTPFWKTLTQSTPIGRGLLIASCVLTTPWPHLLPSVALSVCGRVLESTALTPPFQEGSSQNWSLRGSGPH
jgi:hypothetical protein